MMWFRLARELGMSVRQAQREIDAQEFVEWVAFQQTEPFLHDLINWAAAQLLWWMRRLWGRPGSSLAVKDCLVKFDSPASPRETAAAIKAHMKRVRLGWAKGIGLKTKVRKKKGK